METTVPDQNPFDKTPLVQPEPEEVAQEPLALDDIIASLEGFGVEENEDLLTLKVGGRSVRLRISNLPVEEEIIGSTKAEEYKGPAWINFMKCQLLARAITWIDGAKITPTTYVMHPKTGDSVQAAVALADIIQSWGTTVVGVLWKILMVHTQRIEDRLIQSFPDSVIMTEVEKRFFDRALAEMEEMNRDLVKETMLDAATGVNSDDEG
jgi:hypothetical protein